MGEAIGRTSAPLETSSQPILASVHPCLSALNSRIYTVLSIILKGALYQSSGRVLDPGLFSLKCFWNSHKAEMQMARFTNPITQR